MVVLVVFHTINTIDIDRAQLYGYAPSVSLNCYSQYNQYNRYNRNLVVCKVDVRNRLFRSIRFKIEPLAHPRLIVCSPARLAQLDPEHG